MVRSKQNARKFEQLGEPFGTANNRLKKALLFDYALRLGLGTCFRCHEPIVSIDSFSIEHKESWQRSDDPVRAFFDLTNIAYSHRACNRPESRRMYSSEQERNKAEYDQLKANPTRYERKLAAKRKAAR